MNKREITLFQGVVMSVFILSNVTYALHIEPHIELVSVATDGAQGDGNSGTYTHQTYTSATTPSISADGRYVAFISEATNLVVGDTNGEADVFVRDRVAGTTELISVGYSVGQADGQSTSASISANGRYVAFSSYASNLVLSDTNKTVDIFVRDRVAGTTELVSVGFSDQQGDDFSFGPSISTDGRYVAFTSAATNLVAGDTNGAEDIFIRDRIAGITELISVSYNGGPTDCDERTSSLDGGCGFYGNDLQSISASISGDGRYVAFESNASNLVLGDTNKMEDIFVRDRVGGTTEQISFGYRKGGDNWSRRPSISTDGRYITFVSSATNLVPNRPFFTSNIFVRGAKKIDMELVNVANNGAHANRASYTPSISADGRYIAFQSQATSLVAVNDTNEVGDIFVRDLVAGTTKLVSGNKWGEVGNNGSANPSVSADGHYIAFVSAATNLGPADTNEYNDVYVYYETSYEPPDTVPTKFVPGIHFLLW